MIDGLISQRLIKAIGARRETQRHLNCLTRQIAARARRQAITVKVRNPARRRSGPRHYHRELVERLAFERWGELDGLDRRLAAQEQVIDELEHCDHPHSRNSHHDGRSGPSVEAGGCQTTVRQ